MPLLPKNAGTGAAALAAIMAQAKAEAAAAAIRQVAATVSAPAPKPIQRTTERNSSAYYGYSQPGGNVIVNAPPVNGGQAGEFYASPKTIQRTLDRNSSAFYGARQPATVYQPPVNGGQAGEFYTSPRTFYGPTAFGPTIYGPPAPSGQGQLTRAEIEALAAQQMNPVGYQEVQRQQMIESPLRTQDRNSSAYFGVRPRQPGVTLGSVQGGSSPYGEQVLQTAPGPELSPDSTFYYPVPQSMATAQVPPKPQSGPPPSFTRAVQGFEQDERQFRWRERRIEELDAEIENLRKIMRDGGGNRASSAQLAQWVNEREQLLTGVYGNENTGLLNQLAEGIQEVRDFGPQDMGPLRPLGEFVEAIWDDPRVETVKQGAIWAFEHADVPRQFVTGKFGDALYLLTLTAPEAVEMLSFIPGMDDFQKFVEEANLRGEIMDWYVNGYNGFTGGRAVWEGLIGKTDELPWYLRYPIRLTTDLVMDPLSYAYLVAKVGRAGKITGEALATLPDASRTEKVVGRTMQAMGKTTEFAGHGLDNLFVDVPVRMTRGIGRATGVGRPAAFDLSERALHTRAVTEVTGAARRMERARAAAGQRPAAATETLTVPKPPTDPGAGAQIALPEPRPGGPVTAAVPGSETWPQPREATPSTAQATPQKPKPVDRPAVVTAAGDIVDPPTGQLLPGADDVPKDLPNLRRAAARSMVPDEPRTGGGFRKKGDDFSAPRVDGTRLQDRIATGGLRALANGDTKTARLFENELARYEAKAASELGDNPVFLNWNEGGAKIRVSSADAPFTDEELALFRTASDGTVLDEDAVLRAATESRDGSFGAALQLAHMLHFESYHLDAFRRLFPGTDLPTGANPRFRVNAGAPGSFRDERLYWLMEEYVTTPDPIRAQAIADVLNNPTGPLLRLAPNGKPYLTAIPSRVKRPGANMSIRSEVSTLLHAARKNWDEARATIHKPDVVAQARGGLKAENKRMADAIENAIETEARLKREALQKLAAEGQGEAVVARFQWKIDPGSNWKRGAQTELRRHADGTYHVWRKAGNKRTFEDLGELGDPNSLSTDVSLYKTPDEYIAGMREKGDQFNPATGERNPWAMELAPWETWNDAEVVRHGKSFDAGPSSPENLQYLGRYSPEREATPYQFQDADLTARQAAPETAVVPETAAAPSDVTPPAAGAGDEAVPGVVPSSVTQKEFEEIRDAWNVAYANSQRAWRKSNAAWDTPEFEQAYGEWQKLSEITQRLEAQMDEAERILREAGDDFVSRHSGPLGVAAPPLPGTRFLGRIRQGLDAQIQPSVIPTFDDIVNDDLRWPLELGVNEANWEDAKLLDQVLDGWQPPKKVPDKEEWRVLEAWQHVERVAAIDPTFNLGKAKFEIALRAKGIPIKKAGKRNLAKAAVDELDRAYDTFMNVVQREHRRYGPLTLLRNAMNDTIGTMHQGIATGNIPDALGTLATARAVRPYRKQGRNPVLWAESLDDPFVRGTGQLIPSELNPVSSRGEDPFGGLPTLNAKVAHRNKVVRGLANIWTTPIAKDYLTLVDLVSRASHWKSKYQQFLKAEGMPRFSKLLLNTANGDPILAKQWSDLIEIEARKHAGRRWDGSFSPNDISRALDGQTPQNHALSRAWQRETNIASQQAVKSAKSVYFSFENLNIDEYMRKTFVFHYWQTRAYPLHVRAALRNPVLLNGYYKIHEELQQMAEEGNYPPFLTDTFRFFTTKDGLAGFGSILGAILPTTIVDVYSEQGNKFDVFINQMSPMVSGALGVLGITDRPPNATALRNDMNFIRKFTNYMISLGYDPADLPVIGGWFEPNTLKFTVPEEEILNQLIGAANGALQRLNLGPIQAGEYTPFDRGANELDQLRTWVEVVATEQFGRPMLDAQGNIQWNDEEMALFEQALDGMQTGMDSNPILNEAIERQGKEDGLGAMLNLIAPGGGVVNSQLRTDLQASAKGGDQNAKTMRNIATATDPTWAIANERYHQLGDDASQSNLKFYNQLIYNPESFASTGYLLNQANADVGDPGNLIDIRPLLDMTIDERKEYVNQLFGYLGILDGVQQLQTEREAFKAANPEYADYLTYQSGVYKYEDKPGGIRAWREQLANDNPNFERTMQDQREYLEGIGKKGAVLEAELDDWATGQEAFHAAMGEQFNLYDPEPIRTYDSGNDPLQSSALSFMVPETDQGYPQTESETDKPEKGSAEDLQQRFAENDQNFAFANRAAEELYGDSWDYDAVAQSGEPKEGWIGPGKKPDIAYWPSGSTPGDTTLQDRYAEWKRMMLAAGVPPGQLTIQDWIDWEAGIQEQYFPQQNPYPDLWQPWLEEDQRRSA